MYVKLKMTPWQVNAFEVWWWRFRVLESGPLPVSELYENYAGMAREDVIGRAVFRQSLKALGCKVGSRTAVLPERDRSKDVFTAGVEAVGQKRWFWG